MAVAANLEERALALERLSEWLRVEVVRAVKWLTDTPTYTLWIGGDRVDLGTVDTILSQRKLRGRIAQSLGVLPNWVAEKEWDGAARALLQACEWLEVPTTTLSETMGIWLGYYIDRRPVTTRQDGEQRYEVAVSSRAPVRDERGLWISLEDFKSFVANELREKTSRAELGTALTAHGGVTERLAAGGKGSRIQRRYWLVPEALLPEGMQREGVTV